MKRIATIIPTDLVTNSLLSSFWTFLQTKTRIRFSASWWSGNEKYFCSLFIASRALLQSDAEFNRLLKRNFITCYSCLYFSSMTLSMLCVFIAEIGWSPTLFHTYQNISQKFYTKGATILVLTRFKLGNILSSLALETGTVNNNLIIIGTWLEPLCFLVP